MVRSRLALVLVVSLALAFLAGCAVPGTPTPAAAVPSPTIVGTPEATKVPQLEIVTLTPPGGGGPGPVRATATPGATPGAGPGPVRATLTPGATPCTPDPDA